jgi:hypothetical protein
LISAVPYAIQQFRGGGKIEVEQRDVRPAAHQRASNLTTQNARTSRDHDRLSGEIVKTGQLTQVHSGITSHEVRHVDSKEIRGIWLSRSRNTLRA